MKPTCGPGYAAFLKGNTHFHDIFSSQRLTPTYSLEVVEVDVLGLGLAGAGGEHDTRLRGRLLEAVHQQLRQVPVSLRANEIKQSVSSPCSG